MRQSEKSTDAREPIGIVINTGGRGDATPLVAAFVWGPVPEDAEVDERPATRRAAA